MLFDLAGKRRRVVQATYVMLAVLMGGGLVFFGIGGDVSGGLFDALGGGGGGGSSGNDLIQKRVERNEKRLKAHPNNKAVLKSLVRDNFSLATGQTQSNATAFPAEAKDELQAASKWWKRYLKVEKGKPDSSLARVALQVYDPTALNKPIDAKEAARIIAEAQNEPNAYIQLVQYATLASDTRLADLAGIKAVDLAPKSQKKTVKAQVKLAKQPPQQSQPQG
jgi:hypothetical protein